MKRIAWLLAVLLSAVAANADDVVQIRDVGFNYTHTGGVLPIRLTLHNPLSTDLPLTLQVDIHSYQKRCIPSRFTKNVLLRPEERTEISFPVIYTWCGEDKLDVTAIDSSGRGIGFASTEKRIAGGGVTMLLCVDDKVCDDVQKQVLMNGTDDERNKKSREINFAILREPLPNWWSYEPAKNLILAAPVARFTAEQKQAIENYARRGGYVIIIEDQINDPTFLAAYRQGRPAGGQDIVKGGLFRISSLRSDELVKLFQGKTLSIFTDRETRPYPYNWERTGIGWLGLRVGQRFEFPRLRWMLLWMAAYIIILGAINFAILRRFKRLEWGWITVAVCAVLFSAWFYFSNYYRGPRIFEGTNVAIFWMDERSPVSFAQYAVSVASPKRTPITVSVAGDVVLQPGTYSGKNDSVRDIYSEITSDHTYGEGWNVALNDPQRVFVPMLRWSTQTIEYSGFRTFAGTVHWSAPNKLKNDTGQDFRQAAYVNKKGCTISFIDSFRSGQEIDVTSLPSQPYKQEWNCKGTAEERDRSLEQLLKMPLLEGAAWTNYLGDKGFIGTIDSGTLPVDIDQKGVEWRKAALVAVPLS